MRSLAGRIFRYAVATSRATSDPSGMLRGALTAPKVRHHSAIIEREQVSALLRAIEGYEGQPLTCIALKLTPHVVVRPGELVGPSGQSSTSTQLFGVFRQKR